MMIQFDTSGLGVVYKYNNGVWTLVAF
jgi:hypothetical protein